MNDYYLQRGSWGPVGGGWDGHGFWFSHLPLLAAFFGPVILLVVLWSVFWKGLALWHSARRGQYWWFVILLVVNTVGILEIIYLFAIAKTGWQGLFSLREHGHHS